MINRHKICVCVFLIFLCQNTMSTECVRLFYSFKTTIKGADIAIAGEVIHFDEETGNAFVKVTERFFGNCQDTIRCVEYLSITGSKLIMLLEKLNTSDNNSYSVGECGSYTLYFKSQKNKFSGHITHFNGLICRTLLFCRIYKLPNNHMSYQRIERIIKRKGKNKIIYS